MRDSEVGLFAGLSLMNNLFLVGSHIGSLIGS